MSTWRILQLHRSGRITAEDAALLLELRRLCTASSFELWLWDGYPLWWCVRRAWRRWRAGR